MAKGPAPCDCGRVIVQPARGRKRHKCLVCSPPRNRTQDRIAATGTIGPVVVQLHPERALPWASKPGPMPPVMPAAETPQAVAERSERPPRAEDNPLFGVTLAELRAAGRAETPEGVIVLTLAAQIATGGGSAAGLSALVKQFHLSKDIALKDSAPATDVVSDIFGSETG